MMAFIVYCICNRINGKVYIGMTGRTLEQRWKAHISAARQRSKFRFHSAIRKYGVDNWDMKVLSYHESDLEARRAEETEIARFSSMNSKIGYNAKLGGCGGWVVPANQFEEFKKKISRKVTGSGNPNAYSVSNDELLSVGLRFVEQNGYVPGRKKLRAFSLSEGVDFPKHFTPYRFGGFSGYIAKLVELSGKIYQPNMRDQKQRSHASDCISGRRWYHNDNLRKNGLLRDTDVTHEWKLGRIKYD